MEELKIPVTRFTHLFETDSSYFVLRDRYYSVNDLGAKGRKIFLQSIDKVELSWNL